MSLFAKYVHEYNGLQWERELIEKAGLEVGHYYVIEDIVVGQSYTDVKLKHYGSFNSVFFDFYDNNGDKVNIFKMPKYNPYLRKLADEAINN